ncbi:MAG: 4Fe-4S binding protein [Desulfobacterales bacterium]|nr:4Fe-4S binding protein [Desulfobacterales bacterium]
MRQILQGLPAGRKGEKEREKDPRNLVPYEQLLVDEELCDYCGLCVSLCPEEAIKVEGEPLEAPAEPKFEGKIEIDQDLCIGCGRCAQVCPYQAMDIKKPFQGEIKLVEKNLVRCDPLGCQACFNVCPAKCWYVDERGKAAPVKDQCIFCGACEKACPVSAIEVQRSDVRHTEIKETPWAEEWKQAISAIKTGERQTAGCERSCLSAGHRASASARSREAQDRSRAPPTGGRGLEASAASAQKAQDQADHGAGDAR